MPVSRRSAVRAACAAAGVGLGALLIAAPVAAHVGTDPAFITAGKSALVRFKIGHGCDGSPTVRVAMQMPDGVTSVRPEAIPGWQITTTTADVTGVDGTTSTQVEQITWSGGRLPDDQVQLFGVNLTAPDEPGETLHFKTVQTCESGEHRWIEVPGSSGAEAEEPAPAVRLVEAAAGSSTDDHGQNANGAGGDGNGTVTSDAGGDDSNDGLAMAGVVLGAVGAVLGGGALVTARRNANGDRAPR